MSVFVAIDLSPNVRHEIGTLMAAHQSIPAKWQRAEKLHLTLVFLGNPSAETVETLKPKLDDVATQHAPFPLAIAGAGRFETMRAPTVLWLGVGGDRGPLEALQTDLAAKLGGEDRPYVPHLTLARSQDPAAFEPLMPALERCAFEPFLVTSIRLFESTHHHYRVLHESRLL